MSPRPSDNPIRGSETHHVVFNSPSLRLPQFETGGIGLWVSMSDHSPVVAASSDLPSLASPRFFNAYGLARKLQLRRFQSIVTQLKQFTE